MPTKTCQVFRKPDRFRRYESHVNRCNKPSKSIKIFINSFKFTSNLKNSFQIHNSISKNFHKNLSNQSIARALIHIITSNIIKSKNNLVSTFSENLPSNLMNLMLYLTILTKNLMELTKNLTFTTPNMTNLTLHKT